MGGGTVVDPFSPRRGRARPTRLAWLDAIGSHGPERAIARAIEATDGGVDTGWMRCAFGATEPELERMIDAAGAVRVPDTGAVRCFSAAPLVEPAGRDPRVPRGLPPRASEAARSERERHPPRRRTAA